jgi:AraC-like DNA-binding protein
MQQIRAVSLLGYLDVAASLGLDGAALLRAAGIAGEALSDPENRIPAASVAALLEMSAARSGREDFGLLTAQRRSFADLGPVSMLLEHLPNLREVVRFCIVYRRHFNDIVDISLEEDGETCLIRFGLQPGHWGDQSVDQTIGVAHRGFVGASGGHWRPDCVHLMRQAPRDRLPWQRFFGAPVEFASSCNGFSCAREVLLRPNPLADPTMVQHARRLLGLVPLDAGPKPVGERVRRAIAALLPAGRATLEQVAAQMATSPRSLQRQLGGEGYRFAELLAEVRKDLAAAYLTGSSQPVTSIAALLGYASPSAFTRWFAGAFGSSPQAWRAAAGERGASDEADPPRSAPIGDARYF